MKKDVLTQKLLNDFCKELFNTPVRPDKIKISKKFFDENKEKFKDLKIKITLY